MTICHQWARLLLITHISPPVAACNLSVQEYSHIPCGHMSAPFSRPGNSTPPVLAHRERYAHLFFRLSASLLCLLSVSNSENQVLLLYAYNQLSLHHLFLLHPLIVCGTQCSDGFLVEQITSTSDPPPYDPPRLRSVTETSSSCHSKNLFSVSVFGFIDNHY